MRTASIRAQWEGRLVDGRFALLEWLGGSDDHAVFLTVLQGIQKAAIKLIPAEGAEADSYIAQWEAAKKLSHPHLIAVLDTGRFAIAGTDLVYVVTEFAEKPLSQTIETWSLGVREARGFLDPVLEALAYLHGKGFVHGHVKPSNILMAADQWKLSGDDLLVAGEFPELASIPGGYDAPEVMNGSITPAMDMWSLGMTLTEAVT
ncbi:MAG TPA: protein kinase, partial [Terracidiphilus sp.]|nr:protein kinase [Terracidiphilus sp.]